MVRKWWATHWYLDSLKHRSPIASLRSHHQSILPGSFNIRLQTPTTKFNLDIFLVDFEFPLAAMNVLNLAYYVHLIPHYSYSIGDILQSDLPFCLSFRYLGFIIYFQMCTNTTSQSPWIILVLLPLAVIYYFIIVFYAVRLTFHFSLRLN